MGDMTIVIRILLATLLGGLVGIEREIHGCAAGLRTHILVCVGSTLFMVTSVMVSVKFGHLGDVDPSRIASNIVTGIGFLGAGAIIRFGVSVRGLTTAASIWAIAAVGLAVGAGMYLPAVLTSGVVVGTLFLSRFEKKMESKWHESVLNLKVTGYNDSLRVQIGDIIEKSGGELKGFECKSSDEEGVSLIVIDSILPRGHRRTALRSISALSGVKSADWK